MTSYMTTDLREEINRCCGGEDSRTAIELHRERRQNIEGHNLRKNFDSHAPVRGGPVAHAPRPPNPLEVSGGGGCMALVPHLRMVVWRHKFRPHLPEKYDGMVNPTKFLQIYSTSILTTGGDEAIMANYFPVALTGTPRS
jgi:transposase